MDTEKEPQHVSKDHESFIREFIQVYKDNQVLWDKSHPKYKSRDNRNSALDALLNKSKEYYSDADIDFVKHKIDGLRGGFRREYKKVLESKKVAKTEDDIYIPSLWYYNQFLFTVGEEYDKNSTNEENYKNIYFWTKEHTVTLIDLLKNQPILYRPEGASNRTKGKRMKAYDEITKELIAQTGKHFDVGEVRKKICTLKQQFRRECRNKSSRRSSNSHNLWCYELLMFLKDFWTIKPAEQNKDDKDLTDDSTDNMCIKDDEPMEEDSKDDKLFLEDGFDDVFDTIGKNVAIKLRDMNDDQRKYAEVLINQIMYEGLMENLSVDSKIIADSI